VTARAARATFRKGNSLLSPRNELGAVFADADFANGIHPFPREEGIGAGKLLRCAGRPPANIP
jgi:hypothetical protein